MQFSVFYITFVVAIAIRKIFSYIGMASRRIVKMYSFFRKNWPLNHGRLKKFNGDTIDRIYLTSQFDIPLHARKSTW